MSLHTLDTASEISTPSMTRHYVSSLSALYSYIHLPISRSYHIYIACSTSPTRMYICWICWYRIVQDHPQSEFNANLDNVDAWGPSYTQGLCKIRYFHLFFFVVSLVLRTATNFILKWSQILCTYLALTNHHSRLQFSTKAQCYLPCLVLVSLQCRWWTLGLRISCAISG